MNDFCLISDNICARKIVIDSSEIKCYKTAFLASNIR